MTNIKIAPSILSADFSKLGDEIQAVERSGANYIHMDVMDGHFVPNITIGPVVLQSIRKCTKLPFDVHLMISPVDQYIEEFVKAGSDIITVHQEATIHLDRTIKLIKSFGIKAGVSIVPSTHEDTLDYILEHVDLVLVMTVNPGFGGQEFLHSQLKKIENIRNKIEKLGKPIELEVDGGINAETARLVASAGANVLVAGSYIFGAGPNNYYAKMSELKKSNQ